MIVVDKVDSKQAPDLPEQNSIENESPPPYSRARGDEGDRFPPLASDISPGVQSGRNQIVIETRHEDISGTYRIDPTLPMREEHSGFMKSRKRHHRSRVAVPLNATFRSRHGRCNLNLATAGSTAAPAKANISVATRSGDICINLFSLQAEKRVNVDVYSRRGNIAVFVPRDFRGAIQLRSRRGTLRFLPALESVMRTLKSMDDEALILIGESSFSGGGPAQSAITQDDFCQLTSRSGKITVGLSGEDVAVPEVSLWKKLGEYLWGGSSVRPESSRNDSGQVH